MKPWQILIEIIRFGSLQFAAILMKQTNDSK